MEKRPNTWNPDENNQGSSVPGLEHPGAKRPWIGASGSPGGRRSGGGKKRQGEQVQEPGKEENENKKSKREEERGEGEE